MKQKEILFMLVSTFVLVTLWVGFSIYHSFVSSTIQEPLKIQIQPISPNFDDKAIQSFKKRGEIDPIMEIAESPEENKSSNSGALNPTSTTSAEENTFKVALP
ncbi:hypothetical protein C4559_05985 [Candidatus Microgenomates bacterium]|nr:MAG: hypothetical protein C4559_05985 [Candidatus Microgenomates bacterium]